MDVLEQLCLSKEAESLFLELRLVALVIKRELDAGEVGESPRAAVTEHAHKLVRVFCAEGVDVVEDGHCFLEDLAVG